MRRFVEGADRGQSTLFPECPEDWIGEDNPVRVIDVFVDEIDLAELGSDGSIPSNHRPATKFACCALNVLSTFPAFPACVASTTPAHGGISSTERSRPTS